MTTLAPRPVSSGEDATATRRETLSWIAGGAALLAGVIHLVVTPSHLAEAPVLGVLFLLLGLAQVGLAPCFRLALGVRSLLLVVAVHAVVVALYVASRTIELPFIPPHDAGHDVDHLPVAGGIGNGIPIYPGSRIESLGPLDVACLLAELTLVLAVVALLPERLRARVGTVLAVLAVLGIAGRAVTGLV